MISLNLFLLIQIQGQHINNKYFHSNMKNAIVLTWACRDTMDNCYLLAPQKPSWKMWCYFHRPHSSIFHPLCYSLQPRDTNYLFLLQIPLNLERFYIKSFHVNCLPAKNVLTYPFGTETRCPLWLLHPTSASTNGIDVVCTVTQL